jgi:hypothetical protein
MPIDVEAETEALFARPPEEFTAARNDLARRLRAEQRRDEGGKVATLRRPTLPAWAVNQLVRRHPDRVDELIAAGRQLAQAQRRLLSGVRDDSLREATAHRRELLAELTGVAVGILAEAGAATATHRPAISATLEAASLDAAAAEQVRAGRLSTDLPAPSGFGGVAGLTVVPDRDTAPTDEGTPRDDEARRATEAALEAATAQVEASRRRAASAVEERAEARRGAIAATEEAERLEQRAEQARRKAAEANEHADEADRRAGEAERAVGAAERALAEARAALGELSR